MDCLSRNYLVLPARLWEARMTVHERSSQDRPQKLAERHAWRAIPRLPRTYVPRRRLWGQLELVTEAAVTVVVAPAGAGKTLGVAGWLQSDSHRSTVGDDAGRLSAVMWITADSSWDKQRLGELLEDSPHGDHTIDSEKQGRQSQPLIVIDDAHKLPLSALRLIHHRLDTAPQSIHLLLLSRWDLLMGNLGPELLGNLTTIRGDFLRLDDQETGALIRFHADTDDLELITAIHRQARGWCAVVVLTARAIGAMPDPRAAWQQLISDRLQIADRVVSEVFSTLSFQERHLLLCIAPGEVTTVENAVQLTRDDRAGEILETLESTGLLVTRVDQPRDGSTGDARYRIHPLLAEVVRRRLSVGGVDVQQAQATVERAARLDIDRGDVTAAFDRLVAINAFHSAVDLLASDGLTIWAQGKGAAINKLCQAHPDIVARQPDVWFVVAIERWSDGDVTSAQRWMNRVLKEFGDDPLYAVRAACLRLMLARLGTEPVHAAAGNAQRLLITLQGTIRDVRPVDTAELALLCTEVGITQNWLGDLAHAESNLRAGIGLYRSRGMAIPAASAMSHLAFTEYMSGREHIARQVANEALAATVDSAVPQRFVSARASLVLALCRFLDLPWTTEPRPDNPLSETHHPADHCTMFWFRINAARQRVVRGDIDGAARSLDMPLNLPVLSGLPDHLSVALVVERAFIAVIAGDEALIKELQHQLASSAFVGEAALLGGLRADIRGDRHEALAMFNVAVDDMTFTQLGARAVALTCECQLLDVRGDRDQALQRLQLATAETAVRRNASAFLGWVRLGSPLKPLMDELQRRAPTPWVHELADATASQPSVASLFAARTPTPVERLNVPSELIIPMLSAREREVLLELARGSTYADIGANLFVSENTVKTHVSSLYAKLGATRRSEALAIGRSLHLL
jgi:LuxR family transcriptional regulator, maltose regulon positive regulatory protein